MLFNVFPPHYNILTIKAKKDFAHEILFALYLYYIKLVKTFARFVPTNLIDEYYDTNIWIEKFPEYKIFA